MLANMSTPAEGAGGAAAGGAADPYFNSRNAWRNFLYIEALHNVGSSISKARGQAEGCVVAAGSFGESLGWLLAQFLGDDSFGIAAIVDGENVAASLVFRLKRGSQSKVMCTFTNTQYRYTCE